MEPPLGQITIHAESNACISPPPSSPAARGMDETANSWKKIKKYVKVDVNQSISRGGQTNHTKPYASKQKIGESLNRTKKKKRVRSQPTPRNTQAPAPPPESEANAHSNPPTKKKKTSRLALHLTDVRELVAVLLQLGRKLDRHHRHVVHHPGRRCRNETVNERSRGASPGTPAEVLLEQPPQLLCRFLRICFFPCGAQPLVNFTT